MVWHQLPAEDWDEWVSDTAEHLADEVLGDLVERFLLVPAFAASDGITGAVHQGALLQQGDFKQPALVTAIDGDLTVDGTLSTQGVDGFDGNATLVVFGDLHCRSLINDWASLIIVTGNCTVTDWCFAAREDSSFIVGGDFRTALFVGGDIWVSVGGSAEMLAGYGYALGLNDALPAIHVATGWQETAKMLRMSAAAQRDLEVFMQDLEGRLYDRSTLLP